jgi:hypothetical protein
MEPPTDERLQFIADRLKVLLEEVEHAVTTMRNSENALGLQNAALAVDIGQTIQRILGLTHRQIFDTHYATKYTELETQKAAFEEQTKQLAAEQANHTRNVVLFRTEQALAGAAQDQLRDSILREVKEAVRGIRNDIKQTKSSLSTELADAVTRLDSSTQTHRQTMVKKVTASSKRIQDSVSSKLDATRDRISVDYKAFENSISTAIGEDLNPPSVSD